MHNNIFLALIAVLALAVIFCKTRRFQSEPQVLRTEDDSSDFATWTDTIYKDGHVRRAITYAYASAKPATKWFYTNGAGDRQPAEKPAWA